MTTTNEKVNSIVKSARCFMNGKCVLMGYDKDGKMVFGIGCYPANSTQWVRNPLKKDLVRLQKSYEKYLNSPEIPEGIQLHEQNN